jgi:hypothetical protein
MTAPEVIPGREPFNDQRVVAVGRVALLRDGASCRRWSSTAAWSGSYWGGYVAVADGAEAGPGSEQCLKFTDHLAEAQILSPRSCAGSETHSSQVAVVSIRMRSCRSN